MRYFDAFTGIGGFSLGIHSAWLRIKDERQAVQGSQAGDKNRQFEQLHQYGNEGLSCVGYSEIDKYAISVYEKHYPGVPNYGDITKINAEELPDFDILVGGFPCQAFSIAGKRAGFADTRGTLFFDLARILKEKQPRLFVFENVKGLLSHDKGRTFTTIVATIDELGYDCQWQVLNSKNFGVPQNRERVIIVGHLRGTPRPEVFPLGSSDQNDAQEDSEVRTVAQTITARYYKGGNGLHIGTLRTHKDGNGFRTMQSGISPTIPARAREDGSSQPVVSDGLSIRRLTPLECERLQAFPDDWTKYGMGGVQISDTQRYKMCGNAVTTNVIQAVFERVFA